MKETLDLVKTDPSDLSGALNSVQVNKENHFNMVINNSIQPDFTSILTQKFIYWGWREFSDAVS